MTVFAGAMIPIWTDLGESRISDASVFIGGGMVAAKNIVCLSTGRWESILRMSGRNPMSNMVSASSITNISIFERVMVFSLMWSNNLPGQAITISTPLDKTSF